jgi:hypothetical protein
MSGRISNFGMLLRDSTSRKEKRGKFHGSSGIALSLACLIFYTPGRASPEF